MPTSPLESPSVSRLPSAPSTRRQRLRYLIQAGVERSWFRRSLFWRLPTTAPGIALTFDDGPHPDYTPRILDILREYHVSATFFVIGNHACQFPDIVRQIVTEGHTLACHTQTHADLSHLSLRQAWKECHAARLRLEEIS